MFFRVRLFLLWALMLCVPFQGYAAVAMARCDAGGATLSQTHASRTTQDAATTTTAAAAAVAVAHDHASTGHASATHDIEPLPHATGEDAGHTCGTCGACHAPALTTSLDPPALFTLPAAGMQEPVQVACTAESRLPDRPPRA